MLFDFSLKSSLLLIFFFHGLVFAGLLLQKGLQNHDRSSLWLSLLVFLGALYIAPFMLGYAGWYVAEPQRGFMFFVPFQQLFLLGPVIYFYTQSLLDQSFQLRRRDRWHFVPALLYFLFSLVVFLTDHLLLRRYYFYADQRDMDFDPWYQVAGLLSLLVYLYLSLRYYVRYKQLALQTLSFADTVLFRWVQHFLLALLLISLLRVLFFMLNPEWGEFGRKFWYYLGFSLLFYYITIRGYANSVRAVIPVSQSWTDQANDLGQGTVKAPWQLPDLPIWKVKLVQVMQESRLFLEPELNLHEVAAQLGVSLKQVSQIVNQGFELNFNDFVNQYRTQEVLKKLAAGEHRQKTLLAIALECGFNSKSTFNRAFKKSTGVTPQEYLQRLHAAEQA